MSNQYRLVELGNSELVAGLAKLVRESNELTARVLAHLVELEERGLHLELGFSSLFAYCVEGLGMSEGTAGRRVAAVRVCRRFPNVFERVALGQLHLCALCALAPHLNEQNATELFEVCGGKTRRQIEELLAARFPRPDVREQIRRLPASSGGGLAPSAAACEPEEPVIAARISGVASDPGVRVGSDVAGSRPRGREVEPLSADRFGVHFTADAELRDLIERARALASHRNPKGDLAGLMKLMVARFVEQEEKRRFGVGARRRTGAASKGERAAESTPPGGASVPPSTKGAPIHPVRMKLRRGRGRYLAVRVRRDVYARDGGQCAFVSSDGRRCAARAFLQFDHVEPFARFGTGDVSNMRLLCQAHNLWHARECFGATHVAAKIAARDCLGPDAEP